MRCRIRPRDTMGDVQVRRMQVAEECRVYLAD